MLLNVARLYRHEEGAWNWPMISSALLSGLAGSGVVAAAHSGLHATTEEPGGSAFLAFLFAGIVYVLSLRQFTKRCASSVKTMLSSLRARNAAHLSDVERARFEEHAATIERSASAVALSLHIAMLFIFSFLYMIFLSRLATLGALLIYGACVLIYGLGYRHSQQTLQQAVSTRDARTDALATALADAQNVRRLGRDTQLQDARLQELLSTLRSGSGPREQRARHAALITHLVPAALLGLIVFALPLLEVLDDEALYPLVALSIFIIGLLDIFVAGIFACERADRAAERLSDLAERSAA